MDCPLIVSNSLYIRDIQIFREDDVWFCQFTALMRGPYRRERIERADSHWLFLSVLKAILKLKVAEMVVLLKK